MLVGIRVGDCLSGVQQAERPEDGQHGAHRHAGIALFQPIERSARNAARARQLILVLVAPDAREANAPAEFSRQLPDFQRLQLEGRCRGGGLRRQRLGK